MAACVALSSIACDTEPCGDLDLRASQSGTNTTLEAVVAVSRSDSSKAEILVCPSDCDGSTGTCTDACEVLTVRPNRTPAQLMLTASGRWLVYRHVTNKDTGAGDIWRIDLEKPTNRVQGCKVGDCLTDAPVATRNANDIAELIGTLRGGDWIIYRTTDRQLWAVYVGDEATDELGDELGEDVETEFRLGGSRELLVAAMGHRHIVARELLGDGREKLYLIRIAPARQVDEALGPQPHDALLLATGESFQRVVLTDGPSPAELGDTDIFQKDVRTDSLVIATSGEGSGARTLIYAVADLHLRASFPGEVVTSQIPLEDIPGLSAVSPSGTHLAYIRDGDLMLRDLESQRSCQVRGSTRATHLLAGFAADATLFFEAAHDGSTLESVDAYSPLDGSFTRLTSGTESVWRLQAVPQRDGSATGSTTTGSEDLWAVVTGPGDEGVVIARPGRHHPAQTEDDVSFLPRNGGLWTIAADQTHLEVRPLQANPNGEQPPAPYHRTYAKVGASVCVSASQSSSRATPWATRCSGNDDPGAFLDFGVPDTEQGPY